MSKLQELGECDLGDGHGPTIYVEENEVGGHRYWSDAIGGGVVLWDTCLASISELEFCIRVEKERIEKAKRQCGTSDLS